MQQGCCYSPAVPRRRLGEVDEDMRQRLCTHVLHSHTHVTRPHTHSRTHAHMHACFPVACTHAHANSHARTHACTYHMHRHTTRTHKRTRARTATDRVGASRLTHTLWHRLRRCTAALAPLPTVAGLCAKAVSQSHCASGSSYSQECSRVTLSAAGTLAVARVSTGGSARSCVGSYGTQSTQSTEG